MQKYTRLATKDDLTQIMDIISDAKVFLKKSGSSQWQNGYPNEEVILNDIKKGNGYVLLVGDKVAGYAAVIAGVEPTYQEIDGVWKKDDDLYATIHRICLSANYQGQGLGKIFMSDIISLQYANGVRNFRVDTHHLNKPMQRLASDYGFEYRGIIRVDEDKECPERLAYELNMQSKTKKSVITTKIVVTGFFDKLFFTIKSFYSIDITLLDGVSTLISH